MNKSGCGLDDISSPPHAPVPSKSSALDTNLGLSSNERKITRLNQIDSSGSASKRQDVKTSSAIRFAPGKQTYQRKIKHLRERNLRKVEMSCFVQVLLQYLVVAPERD